MVKWTIFLLWGIGLCGFPNMAVVQTDPNQADENYPSIQAYVRHLIDAASKGKTHLPGVGPAAKVIFPAEESPRLKELDLWMQTNGQSIYGTTASRFRALPLGRSTTKDTRIYLHIFDWPKDGRIVLPGLMSNPVSAQFLSEPNCPVGITREPTDIILAVPDTAIDPIATVIELEFEGTPEITCGPEIFPKETEFTRPIDVSFSDFVVDDSYRIYYTLDGSDPNAGSLCYEEPFTLRQSAAIACRKIAPDGKLLSPISRKTYIKK